MKSYVIVTGAQRSRGIRCLRCKRVSWNPGDVENLYCAGCGRFHDEEVTAVVASSRQMAAMSAFERTVALVGAYREAHLSYQAATAPAERWRSWLEMEDIRTRAHKEAAAKVEFSLLLEDVLPEVVSPEFFSEPDAPSA